MLGAYTAPTALGCDDAPLAVWVKLRRDAQVQRQCWRSEDRRYDGNGLALYGLPILARCVAKGTEHSGCYKFSGNGCCSARCGFRRVVGMLFVGRWLVDGLGLRPPWDA